jgi:rare lipoprotein A
MKSSADLLALLLAVASPQGTAPPQEPQGMGPRGSSQLAGGEVRVDLVDRATVADLPGLAVTAPGLAAGDIAEVTSLDTGRIILARVEAGAATLTLSPRVAQALGVQGTDAPVRMRRVVASPQDVSALTRGEPASARTDAPSALLTALRKKLAPTEAPLPQAGAATPKRAPVPAAPAAANPRGGFGVQVAALSDVARARALASTLGGRVVSGGGLHRIQLGPFATQAQASAARAAAAKRGYPDARIITTINQ